MAPCVRFSLLGKAVPRLIGFCPVCVSWQKRSVTVPFGHRLSDELSEIILDYLHFDHRLTTTVQWHYKMLEKPVVTTNNGLFPVLAANVQNQQNSRFNASLYCPAVVLRPGRSEVRILPVALKKRIAMYFCNALFVLMLLGFRIILAAYHLPHRCTVLLPAVHFSVDLQWYA